MLNQKNNWPRRLTELAWSWGICLASLPLFAVAGNPASTGVAVLNDGRTYQGAIEEVPGGYRVQTSQGTMILPFDEISVTSVSLVGAYEAYRDSMRNPSADNHITLAEWCLSNNLFQQAEIEVRAALRLEPSRSDARALLRQVDAILRPQMAPTLQQAMQSRTAALSAASFAAPVERSNSGLTREAQLEYTTRVQPLLMNKCANAGCHGPRAENRLCLTNARLNSPGLKMHTEHNLEVLFALIDYERADRSPLLTKPNENTPVHKNLFVGARQQPQYEILQQWVAQVVRERSPWVKKERYAEPGPSRTLLIRPGEPLKPLQPTANAITQASAEAAEQPPEKLPATGRAKPLDPTLPQGHPSDSADDALIQQIRESQLPDAFDPEAFNRMMHRPPIGQPAASPTP